MKNFKKLIKEAYLGNPLNESVTPFTRVHYIASPAPRKMLVQDLKNLFGDDLETVTNFMDDGGYESVLVFNLRDSDIERIEDEIGDVITGEYSLKKVKEIQEVLNEENEKWDKISKMEYGKPWMELSIAQKQEMLSYMNRETEKQFDTDYTLRKKGELDDEYDGMTDYQRGRMDEELKLGVKYELPTGETGYIMTGGSKDPKDWKFTGNKEPYLSVKDKLKPTEKQPGKYDGVDFMDENINDPVSMKKQDLKEFGSSDRNALLSSMHINLGYPKEFPGLPKIMDAAGDATDFYMDDFEEYSTNKGRDKLVMSNARTYVRREFPDFMAQAAKFIEPVDEAIDANDPVLMKARAAQMKRDAMDRKDLENKNKRISADKAIDLRYELSILDREREDILMRIEDLGVETDQTAEPEGGEKADDVGRRMEIAIKDLRDIDSKITDIKDDLGIFDMNESVNENILFLIEGIDESLVDKYGKDLINFVVGIDDISEKEIEDIIKKYGSDSFIEYLDDRIQVHLEEPAIAKKFKYIPEGNGGAKQDFTLNVNDSGNDSRALDNEVNRMFESESLRESLRKSLKKRLS